VAGRPKALRALDPVTGDVVREIALRAETACGVAIVGDRFWTTEEDGRLLLCGLGDGSVEGKFPAVPRIAGVAVTPHGVWYESRTLVATLPP
jgi:hypothetical protein